MNNLGMGLRLLSGILSGISGGDAEDGEVLFNGQPIFFNGDNFTYNHA